MNRTRALAFVAAAALGTATVAGAAEIKQPSETASVATLAEATRAAAQVPTPMAIVFASVSTGLAATISGPHGFEVAPVEKNDIVVARMLPNGELVTACVDSDAAAQRFFRAPAVRPAKAPQEQ